MTVNGSSTVSYNGTDATITEATLTGHDVCDGVLKFVQVLNVICIAGSLLVGLVGNVLTMRVMNSNSFSKLSARVFLIALAFSDTTVILNQPLHTMFIIQFFGRDIRAISSFGCKLSIWFFRTGKMMSSWFVVCICVERFVAVLFPFKVKILFTKRRSYMIIAIIFLAFGIFNFRWSFSSNVLNNVICVLEAIDKTDPREVLDYRIMLFLGFSLLVIVPVSILLILTPVIIITLRKQVLNRKNLTNQGKHNKQVLKATTMLISVIVSFVVMATPFGVFHVISFFKSKAIHEENTTLYQSGRGIAQTLDQLNYTVNFFMYVLTSCQFRDAVVALFRSEKPLLSRRRPNISNETIKTTLSSTETVREVRRVSIEDQTTANTSEKEEENHTP
jgi:hypothetical protein